MRSTHTPTKYFVRGLALLACPLVPGLCVAETPKVVGSRRPAPAPASAPRSTSASSVGSGTGDGSASSNRADGLHDFDFFYGKWRVHNKRLVKRLQGSKEWETFEATQECLPVLGGLGNIDELHPEKPQGQPLGMSIRFYNLETKQWSIYWVSSRDGVLQPPVVGSFSNGVGIFRGPDEFQGKPILVRYKWSEITANSARWEQAFSPDNGRTWETNWVMDFARLKN